MLVFYIDGLGPRPHKSVGSQALVISAIQILESKFPGSRYVLMSSHPPADSEYLRKAPFDIEVVQRPGSQLHTIFTVRGIVNRCDAVVSPWGDGYITYPPHFIWRKTLFLKKRGIPLVLATASLGPFVSGWKQYFAREGLRRFDVLTIRDTITLEYLRELGLPDAKLIPDTAFVLKPAPKKEVPCILREEGIPESEPFVGVGVSILMHHLMKDANRDYPALMARLVEHIRSTFNRNVVLIPHQLIPQSWPFDAASRTARGGDDRTAARLTLDALSSKDRVYQITGIRTCNEFKGIIGEAEMFVGGRMHTVIAASSMHVPCAIMQYSHKARGVMDTIEASDVVWDLRDDETSLLRTVDNIWETRAARRKRFEQIMPDVRRRTYALADEVARLLES